LIIHHLHSAIREKTGLRLASERGQTIIEYAAVVGFISIPLFALMVGFGSPTVIAARELIDNFIT
jgi:Flp pilus assembly pilin Flp